MLRLILFFSLACCNIALSQEYTTRAGYDYTLFYNHNSASVYRHHGGAEVRSGNFKYGFDLNSYNIDYANGLPFVAQGLENILSLQGLFSYTITITPSWGINFNAAPHLSWATNRYATLENIIPEGGINFSKQFEGEGRARLKFGAAYTTLWGKPSITPILSYEATFNNLEVKAGIPQTVISYNLGPQHSFSASAGTSSLYSRLPGYSYTEDNAERKIKALEWFTVSAALGYRLTSGTDWDATFTLGKTFYNTFKMSGYGNQHLNIGFDNNLWATLGFNYKLNFKK